MSAIVATTGAPPVDILVTDSEMQPIVIVEVKNQESLAREDAVRLFRDLTSYAALPAAPFVLIVSQDNGYLWKDPLFTAEVPPPLEFPLGEVVGRYVPASCPPRRLRPQEVQIAVARWLLHLAYRCILPTMERMFRVVRSSDSATWVSSRLSSVPSSFPIRTSDRLCGVEVHPGAVPGSGCISICWGDSGPGRGANDRTRAPELCPK